MRLFFASVLAAVVSASVSGCIRLDNPPRRTISATVVRSDDGAPIPLASVHFMSGIRWFNLVPWENFGVDAFARTDHLGRLSVNEKLNDKVRVSIHSGEASQNFEVPPFPPSNRLEGIVWRLKKRPDDL